jgi:flagellar hook-associated protein 2
VENINALSEGVTASLFNDGTGQRLSLTVDKTGTANAMVLDALATSLSFEEVSAARDAVLVYGTAGSGSGVLVRSATNEFSNVISGLDLTIAEGTKEPVTVSVAATTKNVTDQLQEFVDAYNSIRENLDETTDFNAEDQTTGILFGTREALGIETELTH